MQQKKLAISVALFSSIITLGGCGGSSGGGGGSSAPQEPAGSLVTATDFMEPTDYLGASDPRTATDNLWYRDWILPGTVVTIEDANEGIGLMKTGGPSNNSGTNTCPDWAVARGGQVNGYNVCEIRTDLTSAAQPNAISDGDTLNMTNDTKWILTTRVELGNGNAELSSPSDAESLTLDIQEGTEIFGGRNQSWLVVTRGSTILAEGTVTQPITFSSLDGWNDTDATLESQINNDNLDGNGEWGGLVLQGFGPVNQQSADNFNVDAEADLGFYGGTDAGDSSGIVKYVRIAEGGFEVATDEELNGLTVFGGGSGTTIDFVQINNNLDDGIEFFGGTANARHLVLTDNLDDSIDFDLGWQGNLQYVLVTRSGISDRGIESDNDGSNFNNTPRTRPTIANITIISADGDGLSAKHREGMGGFIHNSLYVHAGGAGNGGCISVNDQDSEINSRELTYDSVIVNCTGADIAVTGSDEFADQLVNLNSIVADDPMLNAYFQADEQVSGVILNEATDFAAVQAEVLGE